MKASQSHDQNKVAAHGTGLTMHRHEVRKVGIDHGRGNEDPWAVPSTQASKLDTEGENMACQYDC